MRTHALGDHPGAGETIEEGLDASGGETDLSLDEVEQADLRTDVLSIAKRNRTMLIQRAGQSRVAVGEQSQLSRHGHSVTRKTKKRHRPLAPIFGSGIRTQLPSWRADATRRPWRLSTLRLDGWRIVPSAQRLRLYSADGSGNAQRYGTPHCGVEPDVRGRARRSVQRGHARPAGYRSRGSGAGDPCLLGRGPSVAGALRPGSGGPSRYQQPLFRCRRRRAPRRCRRAARDRGGRRIESIAAPRADPGRRRTAAIWSTPTARPSCGSPIPGGWGCAGACAGPRSSTP